jgi:3-dehydro-4-phosphotetronate decarboxylase
MSESALREEICRVGASLFARGYVHSTAGSISVRSGQGFLVTPTDACLGFLDPARLSLLGPDGAHRQGDAPSKTWAIHRHIYAAAPHAHAVIHTHSSACVATSLQAQHPAGPTAFAELLKPITPYFVMKVGHVPLLPYLRPGSPEMGRLAEQALRDYAAQALTVRALMSSRLGPTVWGAHAAAAMATLEELEETAKLWLYSQGTASALDEVALAELRQVFQASW